jgi:hypothetical protein
MTITRAFVKFLQENLGIATFGQDLFIGGAPSSDQVPDAVWWVKTAGGVPQSKAVTGGIEKAYRFPVYYRDRDAAGVDQALFDLEESLNCAGCVELEGFEVTDVSTTSFPTDNDLDSESRKVGLLEVTITTFKECN